MNEAWVWVRVPLRLIEEFVRYLKDKSAMLHRFNMRVEADQASQDAEDLKRAARADESPPVTYHKPEEP